MSAAVSRLILASVSFIEHGSAIALLFNSTAVQETQESSTVVSQNSFKHTEVLQLAQAARAAHATHAAHVAEVDALAAQRAAEEAEEYAAATALEYAKAKAAAKFEVDKLTDSFGPSASKLLETANSSNLSETVKSETGCQSWCSSTEHSDKPWTKKCSWKDCKGCSICPSMLLEQSAKSREKAALVGELVAAVARFAKDEKADIKSFVSDLAAKSTKTQCEEHCSTKWVNGMTLQEQQSYKSWEQRCGWNGCEGCQQCINVQRT